MTKVNDLHRKWMKSAEYRKAYEKLAREFAVARAVIKKRVGRTRKSARQEELEN